jgi:DNA-binding beta-propeller fold protein YncE
MRVHPVACGIFLAIALAPKSGCAQTTQSINLPSSKKLGKVPGAPQRVNAMPAAVAVTADGSRIAFVHTAYGADANQTLQSITIVDKATGGVSEYNEAKLKLRAKQTFSFGAAFSLDGTKLYVPFGSITDPLAKQKDSTGNAIGVYALNRTKLTMQHLIALPPRDVPQGKRVLAITKGLAASQQAPFPAGLAVFRRNGAEKLLVAEQLSDTASVVDVATGKLEARIDVGSGDVVPSVYPYAALVNREGTRGYISLWNGSQVVELDLQSNAVTRRFTLSPPEQATGASSHSTAMALSPNGRELYVTLANRDQIAAIDLANGKTQFAKTTPPQQKYVGAYPNAVAVSGDGKTVFVANASQDSVAVLSSGHSELKYQGSIPTEWYPTGVVAVGDQLFIATAKGTGTGPNGAHEVASMVYGPKLERGSIARVAIADVFKNLPHSTQEVIDSNLYQEAQRQFEFAQGKNPIKHVIYVIKENRTYDQVFGDIKEANGDPGLVMFGEDITPNQHALARQFGVLDNFYDSGEVSGSGHVWSMAAITSDYTERIWPINYRSKERNYDFEGNVSNSLPLELGIPDVNEPSTGYLWTNLARHGLTYRHYGEYIESRWCGGKGGEAPEAERTEAAPQCPVNAVEKGQPLPITSAASPYPWNIKVLYKNTAVKPELVGHFDPNFPDFELSFPDQLRADEFLREFKGFVAEKNMPQFILLRLPNDHTSGAREGMPTPKAAVADNDLALGRVVDAISHSPYWDDTAMFVLEDDAQNGADHVDAHRSIGLVISKYSPAAQEGKPFVESGFYTTVNMIHTMEALLGLPPMNANDAYAPIMYRMFSGKGDQKPFTADYRVEKNGQLYEVNTKKSEGAKQSAKLDFSHADAVDVNVLNRIIWRSVKGKQPEPKPVHNVFPASAEKDDD